MQNKFKESISSRIRIKKITWNPKNACKKDYEGTWMKNSSTV